MRERRDRGMSAVRRREGVVDINLAELGKRTGKIGRIGLLARVKAEIFEERHLPWPECGDELLCRLADAIRGEADLAAAERLPQRHDQRAQRQPRVGPALRSAEMRHYDDRRTLAEQRLDRRREAFDAGRVGDPAVLDRDVQIGPQQYAFAAHIDVVEGREFGHGRLRRSVLLPGCNIILALPRRSRLYRLSWARASRIGWLDTMNRPLNGVSRSKITYTTEAIDNAPSRIVM